MVECFISSKHIYSNQSFLIYGGWIVTTVPFIKLETTL